MLFSDIFREVHIIKWILDVLICMLILFQTSAEKYMGLQNYFVDVSIDNALELHFVNNGQRQKIITMLSDKQGIVSLI